jgi:predicted nucleic-acid-binding protein
MKIVADTNLLVRLAVSDEPGHMRLAAKTVKEAEAVIVGNLAISEMVWVLRARYRFSKAQIAQAIGNLRDVQNVVVDATAVEAGLAAMRSGADFADGIIAHEGVWLSGEEFVSFDKKAVAALEKQGQKARVLG